MKSFKSDIAFAFTLTFAACAHEPIRPAMSEKAYGAHVNQWVGKPAADLVKSLGWPDSQVTSPDGLTIYVYESVRAETAPLYVDSYYTRRQWSGPPTVYGGETNYYQCKTWYEVDAKMVKSVKWRGNDCLAVEVSAKRT